MGKLDSDPQVTATPPITQAAAGSTSGHSTKWLPWCIALVACLLVEVTLRRGLSINPDGWWYWQGALGLAEGRGFVGLQGEPIVAWPVGFSWWLSLWIRVFGDSASTLIHALAATTALAAAGWTVLAQRVQARSHAQRHPLQILAVALFVPAFLALQVRGLHAETLLDALLPWTLWAALASGRSLLALFAAALGFALCVLVRNSAPVFLPGLMLLVFATGDRDTRQRVLRTALFALLALGMGALFRVLTGPGPEALVGSGGTHPMGGARLGPLSQAWELVLGIDKAFGPKILGILLFAVLAWLAWTGGTVLRNLLLFVLCSCLASAAVFCLVYIHDPLEGRFLRFAPALLVPTVLLASRWRGPRWLGLLLLLLLVAIPLARSLKYAWKGRGPAPAAASIDFAPRKLCLRELR